MVDPAADTILPTIPHDPYDDPMLETAVAGRADVLGTLDGHFQHPDVLAFCAAQGIRVLHDVELRDDLRSAKRG